MSAYVAAWRCPECLATNEPARTDCRRCGHDIRPGGDA